MSGLGIRLYTDEDVDVHLAEQLRRHGYDAMSCRDAGNAGQHFPDEWQLNYAAQQGRAILVHNISDYLPIDAAWKALGRTHHGIIAVQQTVGIGELLRRVQRHLDSVLPEDQRNLVRFLPR